MKGRRPDPERVEKGRPARGGPRKDLRRRAEERLKRRVPSGKQVLSPEDEQRMMHELQVHQIELEMQNEELEMARRIAETAQEKYRALYDFAPVGYLSLEQGGKILELNLTGSLILGKPRARIAGRRFQSFLTQESIPVFNAFRTRVLGSVDKQTCEVGIPSNGDEVRFLRLEGIPFDSGNGVMHVQVAMIDVTERRKAAEALTEQLSILRGVLESSGSPVFSLDRNYCYTSFNSVHATVMRNIYGAEIELGRSLFLYQSVEEDRIKAKRNLDRALRGEQFTDESFSGEEGSRRFFEITHNPIQDPENTTIGVAVFAEDITESRKAEDVLRESEAKLNAVLQGSPIPQMVIGRDHRIVYWNRALEELSGIRASEVVGTTGQWKPFYPHERPVLADLLIDGAIGQIPRWYKGKFRPSKLIDGAYEAVDFFPNLGRWLYFTAAPVRDARGSVIGAVETLEDITERKQAEEAIENIAKFPSENPSPVLRVRKGGIVLYSNAAGSTLLGEWKSRSGYPVPADWRRIIDGVLLSGERKEIERMHGDRTFWYILVPFPDAGYVNIYGMDITDRKKAEEALHESGERLKKSEEIANLGSWELDLARNRLTWSDEVYRIFGLKPQEFGATYEAFLDHVHPDDRAKVDAAYSGSLRDNRDTYEIEHRVVRKDTGEIRFVHEKCVHSRDATGRIIRSMGMVHDITERKRADEALRETSQYLENLITHANTPIIVWDTQFRITRFNHAFERLTGRSAEEVMGKSLEILFPPEYVDASMDHIRRAMAGQRWEAVEIPILGAGGETRTVLWNSATLFEADGVTVSSAIAQGQDITDRKRAEQELAEKAAELAELNAELSAEIDQRKTAEEGARKALSILHAALESTADAMLVVDKSGRITGYNQNFTTMWHIPEPVLHTLDTRIATEHLAAQVDDPDGFMARLEGISNHPSRESYDMLELLDGRIMERYSKPQRIGNTIVGRVFSYRDVTERRRAEERLITSLDEKEVLLREIHHRVKNNLQLTTSLLDMTRMRTTDPATGSILTDVMMKIQTMAQIHTRLYESKRFDRINMAAQIRDQIRALAGIYGGRDRDITVEIESPDIYLPIDQAIPCALALNEILSNTYKHAFAGEGSGTVKYRAKEEGGRIRFTVSDNGIGLPREFDLNQANTLGLKLVRTLVEKQLRGTLRMKRRKRGTEVIVEIPVKSEEGHVKDTRG